MKIRILLPIVLISATMVLLFAGKLVVDRGKNYTLTIATAGKWGTYYPFSEILAELISKHQPNIELEIRETRGSQENMRLLEDREVDLAISQGNIPATTSARAVAVLFPEVLHLIATKASAIEEISDIRGKRVALLLSEGSGAYMLFQQIIEHYMLSQDDFELVEPLPERVTQALADGELDAISHTLALGNKRIHGILNSTDTKLIPIDQGPALETLMPFLKATIIPKGCYGGAPATPEKDIPAVSVVARLLAHKDVEENVINEITRIIFEYRSELVMDYPLADGIGHPNTGPALNAPLHPGAKTYYDQNKPGFLLQYAEVMALLLSVSILLISGLWQLRSHLQQRQKNQADMYNNKIVKLVDKARKEKDLEKLELIHEQLFDVFRKAISDYDMDKISFEAFQSLTFPWEVAIRTVRHRELLLSSSFNG